MIIKRKYKCTGCGEDRPCIIEINRESSEYGFFNINEDLKCVLDETNQTSYNWKEMSCSHKK